jgi:hypothetical protein
MNTDEHRTFMLTLETTVAYPETNVQNLWTETQFLIGGWLHQLREFLLPSHKEKTSRQSLLRADFLAKRFSNSELYPTPTDRANLITSDLEHIGCEAILGQPLTSWETIIYPDEDLTLAGHYQEDLGVMTHNFIEVLGDEGKTQSRAEIETKNAYFMKQWAINNADSNSILIWTSPPDSEAQGYQGSTSKKRWHAKERHHSFFYVMRAKKRTITDEGGQPAEVIVIQTDQLRAWPNISQLAEIHTQLSQTQNSPLKHLEFNDGSASLLLTDNLIELEGSGKYETDLEQLKEIIYQDQRDWLFSPEDMPQVKEEAFWTEFNQLTADFYLHEALPLFEQITQQASSATDDQFWYSTEYQQILDQLDALFDYWAMALQKWVEVNDVNPNSQTLTIKKLFKNLKSLPLRLLQKSQPKPEKNTSIPTQGISSMYHIDIKKRIFGQKITGSEKEFYLNNINLLSLGGSFLSLAQCGIMTPFTLPFTTMRQNLSLGNFSQFELSIKSLPLETQKQLLSQFQNYVSLEIAGSPQKFMVPRSYLGECYLENNQVMGPCGIPLSLDPDALPMSATQFGKLLGGFESLLNRQETGNLHSHLLQLASSPQEQQQATLLIGVLDSAFNNQSLGLTQLLANDIRPTIDAIKLLPSELLTEVQRSNTSFKELIENLVQKLLLQHQDVLESSPEFNKLQLSTITS